MSEPDPRALASVYLRAGNLTFGGGDPTMAVLQRELLDRRKWLTSEQYGLAYGLARVTPGTNVLAFCAGSGWMLRGWRGAVLAVIAACLPSGFVALALISAYGAVESVPWTRAALAAVAASVVGMMLASAILLLRPQLRAGRRVRSLLIAAAAFAASYWFGLTPVPILAAAALLGYFWKEPEAA